MRLLLLSVFTLAFQGLAIAQGCCSGGSGSPIAGGAATGVLQKYQMEISTNYQTNYSEKFYAGTIDTTAIGTYDRLESDYLFLRADYGITKKLTLSVATGYYLDKTLLEKDTTIGLSTKGLSDLIFFPRYDVFNRSQGNTRSEITLGLGLKVPLGSHNDSTEVRNGIYNEDPPTVQLSTGSTDIMFYAFFFREYKKQKLRLFSNMLHT